MNDRKTNEEFVVEIMNFSRHGAIVQAFVIESLRYYSELISKTNPKEVDTAFISGSLWKDIAIEIQEKLKANYESM